jgi:hypothetical protein
MSAIAVEAKTLSNHLGLERGLWEHQTRTFLGMEKKEGFRAMLKVNSATHREV